MSFWQWHSSCREYSYFFSFIGSNLLLSTSRIGSHARKSLREAGNCIRLRIQFLMFWGKCSIQTIFEPIMHVLGANDSDGLPEQMRNGNKLRFILHQIFIRGWIVHCLSLAAQLNVYRLRINFQIPINLFYGPTSTYPSIQRQLF